MTIIRKVGLNLFPRIAVVNGVSIITGWTLECPGGFSIDNSVQIVDWDDESLEPKPERRQSTNRAAKAL